MPAAVEVVNSYRVETVGRRFVVDQHDVRDPASLESVLHVGTGNWEGWASSGTHQWLCSEESRYFTGNTLRLDAGADLR